MGCSPSGATARRSATGSPIPTRSAFWRRCGRSFVRSERYPPSLRESLRSEMLKQITPEEADRLVRNGAVLVDVREEYEQAMERIPGSVELPLSRLAQGAPADLPAGRAPI